jgi:hypothetical protein
MALRAVRHVSCCNDLGLLYKAACMPLHSGICGRWHVEGNSLCTLIDQHGKVGLWPEIKLSAHIQLRGTQNHSRFIQSSRFCFVCTQILNVPFVSVLQGCMATRLIPSGTTCSALCAAQLVAYMKHSFNPGVTLTCTQVCSLGSSTGGSDTQLHYCQKQAPHTFLAGAPAS